MADPLRPRLDLDIAAALRPEALPARIAAVRWAARPALGFPTSGFRVYRMERIIGSSVPAPTLVGTFHLPASDAWDAFAADAATRAPISGPWFDDITEADFGYLLPLIRSADPRVPLTERLGLLPAIADFFGSPHTAEPFYRALVFSWAAEPTLDQVLADPVAGPVLAAYYGLQVMAFLNALALRFEYALLLGLATEDDITPDGDLWYQLAAWWGTDWGTAASGGIDGLALTHTQAPAWASGTVVDGNVGHPAFTLLTWEPPEGYVPVDGTGAPVGVEATYPRPGATHTALTWDTPVPSAERLLVADYPVAFRVRRFEHGPGTAGDASPPPAPPARRFTELTPGALQVPVAGSATQAADGPGRHWPPLEGWVRYRVAGVSVLGIDSDDEAETAVRHADDVGPPPPRIRALDATSLTYGPDRTVTVRLRLDYGAAQDLAAPDAAELRIEASWTPTAHAPITITSIITGLTDARVAMTGPSDPGPFASGQLEIGGRTHRVLAAAAGTLTVTLHAGDPPALGPGLLVAPGPPTEPERVAAVRRPPSLPGLVTAVAGDGPLEVRLPNRSGRQGETAELYLQLLRTAVTVTRAGDRWRVQEPPAQTPGGRALAALRAAGRLTTDLAGSPSILYRGVETTLHLAVPDGFEVGTLTLTARASDAKPYVIGSVVASPDPSLAQRNGNEGGGHQVTLAVTGTVPPADPTVPASGLVWWATSATSYDPVSRAELTWGPAPGALRYEVWRLLEPALGSAAPPGLSDGELVAASLAAIDRFELRTDQAWAPAYTDELPGRAPTRAVYLVRAVDAAGTAGPFGPPLGPVHVPDVRAAAPAEVATVRRAAPSATGDGGRTVVVTVTGPELGDPGVGYRLERRTPAVSARWEPVAELVPPVAAAVDDAGRLRAEATDSGVQPGIDHQWRVTPYRLVADPIDPAGAATRTIDGPPSAPRTGRSTGDLTPPPALTWVAGGGAALSWSNPDFYDLIVVERLVGPYGPARALAELPGDATSYTDPDNVGPTATGATYSYRLSCRAGTATATVRTEGVIGAP